jgi:hypothetical protein
LLRISVNELPESVRSVLKKFNAKKIWFKRVEGVHTKAAIYGWALIKGAGPDLIPLIDQ